MPLNPYRIMWLFVFFDLPTVTPTDRKRYTVFRKKLMEDGFVHLQHSVYLRHCASRENADLHAKRVQEILPKNGLISILRVTDKQFGLMETFESKRSIPPPHGPAQLEIF